MVEWNALWVDWSASLRAVARVTRWPDPLLEDSHLELIVPLSRRLWPDEPWDQWVMPDTGFLRRATVPWIRRTACLLMGFHLGGCSMRGVWEAIALPGRLTLPSEPL